MIYQPHLEAFPEKLICKICNLKTPRVDLIFDQIKSPSIQDYERDHRSQVNDRSSNYHTSGPAQTRPPNYPKWYEGDIICTVKNGKLLYVKCLFVLSRYLTPVVGILSGCSLHPVNILDD